MSRACRSENSRVAAVPAPRSPRKPTSPRNAIAAATAAGLADTLTNGGPYTLFAPTDAAFAALPAGTVESLLKPENKDKLIAILTYHVVPGAVTSDQLAGKRMFHSTLPAGAQRAKLALREADGSTRVLLDPEKLGADVSLNAWSPSPDGKHVSYVIARGGGERGGGRPGGGGGRGCFRGHLEHRLPARPP